MKEKLDKSGRIRGTAANKLIIDEAQDVGDSDKNIITDASPISPNIWADKEAAAANKDLNANL